MLFLPSARCRGTTKGQLKDPDYSFRSSKRYKKRMPDFSDILSILIEISILLSINRNIFPADPSEPCRVLLRLLPFHEW